MRKEEKSCGDLEEGSEIEKALASAFGGICIIGGAKDGLTRERSGGSCE